MSRRRHAPTPASGRRPVPATRQGPIRVTDGRTLARAADAVVEATCLIAVAVLPLYFSLLTSTVYETDKAVLLIALASIAGGAWIIASLASGASWTSLRTVSPLIWLGTLFFAAYGIATILSIDRAISFYGSLMRHDGLQTMIAVGVFFLCAATRLRQHQQMDRLIAVLIVASVPAVVYGLLQQIGIDPVRAFGDRSITEWPVRSSFGEHIQFAAFLVLVIPPTAAYLVGLYRRRAEYVGESSQMYAVAAVAVLVLVPTSFVFLIALGNHVAAVSALFPCAFAGYALLGVLASRLPRSRLMWRVLVGACATILAAQVAVLLFTSARGPLLGAVAGLLVLAVLIGWKLGRPRLQWAAAALAIAGTVGFLALSIPASPLSRLGSTGTLSHFTGFLSTSSPDTSVQGRLLVWHGVTNLLTSRQGIGGTWGGIGRDIVGYGPDTLRLAFEAVYPLKLRQESVEHYTVDRAHSIYLQTVTDAGLLALVALLVVSGYALWRLIQSVRIAEGTPVWLLIGIASAVVGHLVEGLFGIDTAATLLIFWLFLGLSSNPPQPGPDAVDWVRADRRALDAASAFWPAAILLLLLLAVLPIGADHPEAFAVLWLLGTLAAVVAVTFALFLYQSSPAPQSVPRSAASRRYPNRIAWGVATGVVGLAALLALLSQWRFEVAAFADNIGSVQFSSGKFASGLGDVQLAARDASYEPSYRQDLGHAFLTVAQVQVISPNLLTLPGAPDPRSEDPATVLQLVPSQLRKFGLDELRAAISLAPLDPSDHEALGVAYLHLGRPGSAFQEFHRAVQLSANNPTFIADESLAEAALRAGRPALTYAQNAVALDPLYWYSRYALASALHALGRHVQARQEAALGLSLSTLAISPPPAGQMDQLRKLARVG